MKKRVPLQGRMGHVLVDTEATKGAIVGTNLYWSDGSLVQASDFAAAVADDPSGVVSQTLWTLVAQIPVNVQAVAEIATDGVVRKAGAVWTASALANTDLSACTTAGLAENTNLYFTDERARDAIGAALVAGSNVTITVNDAGDTITIASTGGGSSGTPPLAANFTVFGPCSIADKTGRMVITATQQSNSIQGGTQALPATPYTIDITLAHAGAGGTSAGGRAGLCLSDGTKYLGFYVGVAGSLPVIQLDYWTANNSFSATDFQLFNAISSINGLRLRITNDGTNKRYWVSGNGLDFAEVFSQTSASRFTPTQCGPAVYNYPTTSKDSKTSITNWLVTPSILGDAA